jgi:hypothetical protein
MANRRGRLATQNGQTGQAGGLTVATAAPMAGRSRALSPPQGGHRSRPGGTGGQGGRRASPQSGRTQGRERRRSAIFHGNTRANRADRRMPLGSMRKAISGGARAAVAHRSSPRRARAANPPSPAPPRRTGAVARPRSGRRSTEPCAWVRCKPEIGVAGARRLEQLNGYDRTIWPFDDEGDSIPIDRL